MSQSVKSEEARRKAEQRFTRLKQRDDEARKAYEELERVQQAEASKTAKLRALRLAKEEADTQAAARAAAEKAASVAASTARKAAARRAKDTKEKSPA